MKRMYFCLVAVAAFCLSSMAGAAPQTVQPFSAVFWTTTTFHSPSGKAFLFTRRTVYTRDALGNTRTERYQPTKGLLQDTTAPLEHVSTASTSAQAPLPVAHRSGETVQLVDLGKGLFSGFATLGTRQTYKDSNNQVTHTVESWFCPGLGLTTHMTSSNAKGDTVNGDLVSLQLTSPVLPIAAAVSATSAVDKPAIPLIMLYRNLFTLVDHMEQDRQANDPNRHVNMAEIEDHLRSKLQISPAEWQTLVVTSARVESYTHEKHEEARSFAIRDQAARKDNPLGPNTLASGRATLHRMQFDLNNHVQVEIDGLKSAIRPAAADHIQAYVKGPLAASTRAVPHAARLRASQATKEQAR